MIAVTQARGIGPGKDYVYRLLASGKTRTEAIRLLRRRLSDAVFAALRADECARKAAAAITAGCLAAICGLRLDIVSIAELDRSLRNS